MYKEHAGLLKILFVVSVTIAYLLNFRYSVIASDVISIMSITSAVYLAVYAGIQSSDQLKEALRVRDRKIPTKTELGVINTYIKHALIVSTIAIVLSILVLLLDDRFFNAANKSSVYERISQWLKSETKDAEKISTMKMFERIISSVGLGILSVNFAAMWMVGGFMVNRIFYDR